METESGRDRFEVPEIILGDYLDGVSALMSNDVDGARRSLVRAYRRLAEEPKVEVIALARLYGKLAVVEALDGHPKTAVILQNQAQGLLNSQNKLVSLTKKNNFGTPNIIRPI